MSHHQQVVFDMKLCANEYHQSKNATNDAFSKVDWDFEPVILYVQCLNALYCEENKGHAGKLYSLGLQITGYM